MGNTILPKRRFTTGVPTASQLQQGEIAINLFDKKIYSKDSNNNIVVLGIGNAVETNNKQALHATDALRISGNRISLYKGDGNYEYVDISIPDANAYDIAHSFLANGYQKLSNGLIIQWGNTPDESNMTTVTYSFPIAFPNGCLGLVANRTVYTIIGNTVCDLGASPISNTQFSITRDQNAGGYSDNAGCFWFAIGY